jgi:hypothetical protein
MKVLAAAAEGRREAQKPLAEAMVDRQGGEDGRDPQEHGANKLPPAAQHQPDREEGEDDRRGAARSASKRRAQQPLRELMSAAGSAEGDPPSAPA